MIASDEQAIIRDIGREVVAVAAPEELLIFHAASAAYFANPERALKTSRSRDNVLGFGLDPVGIVLTPVVLSIMHEVFGFLMEIAEGAIKAGLQRKISDLIRSMFKKNADSGTSILTSRQIKAVHEKVLLAANKLQLPSSKAESLADAVTAQLALA
ncbi:MAG: hypothetical protein JO110_26210, partial [Acetobacteraceae bacterium]|nr:hypothetical protein [Acetobacteraceae bacterium]